jgi:hypothetical protein
MSKGSYPLKLPQSIKRAAERLAKEDGVSLNQWISVAVAQKVGSVETAAEFLRRRAGNARVEDIKRFMAEIPDVPPVPGDEIMP